MTGLEQFVKTIEGIELNLADISNTLMSAGEAQELGIASLTEAIVELTKAVKGVGYV